MTAAVPTLLLPPGTRTPGLIPRECQANSTITRAVTPDSSPIYQAVRAFITGGRGQLPLTSNWTIEAATCTPDCKYGTCIKVREGNGPDVIPCLLGHERPPLLALGYVASVV